MQAQTHHTALYQTEAEFEAQFKVLYAPLCRYAMAYLHDPDESEDVVQKVFIQTWEKRTQIQLQTSPKSYLYKAVYHACVSNSRHKKVKNEYMEYNQRELESGAGYAHEHAEAKELEQKILAAIEELPEQCGKTFKLSRFHKLTYQEIAQVMGISVKTVENHMGKALGLMRLKLADFLTFLLLWLIQN